MSDSLDQICEQIEKVVRNESEEGDSYFARLRDGRWVHFCSMNDILRRFIFDNKHCKRTAVNLTGQTEYYR